MAESTGTGCEGPSLAYRTTAVLCVLVGLLALIILSANEPADVLGPLLGVPLVLGVLSGGRWLYRRLRRPQRRPSHLRGALDAVPRWVLLLGLGPVLMGPLFIAGGADVGTAAAVSLLFVPAFLISFIGAVLLSFWLLAGPVWLLSRLWPRSPLVPPRLEELKAFTKDMTVGIARDLRS